MEEKEVYGHLTPVSTPLIQTDDIVNNLKQFVSITPGMWEDFFKYVSQIPQYCTIFYKKCLIALNKLVKWFISWLAVRVMTEITLSYKYKTNDIWRFVATNDKIVITTVFKGTLYEKFNISKIYDDHVYFNYLISEEISKDSDALLRDCGIVLKHIEFIQKNDIIDIWNKLQTSDKAKYEYFDSSFDSFYNYVKSNDGNIQKIKKLVE